MKYIDAEKLITEIERRIAAYQKNFDKADNKIAKLSTDGRIASLKGILPFITSLQQEQPEMDIVSTAKVFLDALSKTPYNNKPITDAQIIVKQLLLFFENPSKYNPDAIVEQPKVDLEKEIKSFTEDLFHKVFDEDKSQDDFDWDDITTVIEYTAKYFVELGIQKSNHNKNEEKSYRNHFIDWQRNTDINKPTKNHSILMQTTHGIAEGEWNGEKWIQYRWNCLLKDEDVLAWIELSNIEIPPSISLNLD